MLVRGIYALFLRDWMEVFPRDQFLILETEEVRRNPDVVLEQLVDFLGTSKNLFLFRGRRSPHLYQYKRRASYFIGFEILISLWHSATASTLTTTRLI